MPSRREKAVVRKLRRTTLVICAVFLPLYLVMRLTGGSTEKLNDLPEILDRWKKPVEWEVPEKGVRYLYFFHGDPSPGYKFVLVQVRMEARAKLGYPIVPRCFRLVDDADVRHYPLSRSPLFIERGNSFRLDQGETFDEELLFEVPTERDAVRLLFDRYTDNSEGE